MDEQEYLDRLLAGEAVEAGSEMHLMMHGMSQEAIRICMDINGTYHTPDELKRLMEKLIPRLGRYAFARKMLVWILPLDEPAWAYDLNGIVEYLNHHSAPVLPVAMGIGVHQSLMKSFQVGFSFSGFVFSLFNAIGTATATPHVGIA